MESAGPQHGSQADETHEPPAERKVPLKLREWIGLVGLVALCDVTIYRGEGFAGYALLFVLAPVFLWMSAHRRHAGASLWIVAVMLLALAGKLLWLGSASLVSIGFVLIAAFAMSMAGLCPYVLELTFFTLQIPQAGYQGLDRTLRRISLDRAPRRQVQWLNVLLPMLALLVFGGMFIFANPDLVASLGEQIRRAIDLLREWIDRIMPEWLEMLFWFAVVWVAMGLLHPSMSRSSAEPSPNGAGETEKQDTSEAALYPAFRNTMVTVIVLFAVYLVFEFATLWFREFEEGFYYSGYAHEGAAWLTAALALATVVLSLVFRGNVLADPRIGKLRRLAWVWSLENVILAVAVYHRLFIYIGFNGMTRMRIVGLYGMTAVLVGFILVVWKIVHNRGFLWLIRGQLWTLAFAVYVLAMTPLDTIVVSYNVQRILAGDPAPSVQISVHPINSEGLLLLLPLLDSDNDVIREGVRALLAQEHEQAERRATRRDKLGWTSYQIADSRALAGFRNNSGRWQQYTAPGSRAEATKRFDDYAYRWY